MDFAQMAKGVEKEIIALRRDFHAHPEVAFNEVRTSGKVEEYLKSLGIKTRRMAETGIAGYLDVPRSRRTIALRADMDALPITEQTGLPFSAGPGAMHACGHDCHTATLLGVARILSGVKDQLAGSVRFIFQPAEELPPGGAKAMVAEGVMKGVDEVYGLHVASRIPAGRVVAEHGAQMANVDSITITIRGKGAHGATPNLSVDPVMCASEAVLSLQQIVSRNILPVEPAVVSICAIEGGTAFNVIPETCTMRGTIRTFSKQLRRRMPSLIKRVLTGVTRAYGASFDMNYDNGYDALVNDEKATEHVQQAATELFGRRALYFQGPRMGAEDFSEYLKVAPGCFFCIGVGNKKKKSDVPHHNPLFKVDESVLWRGAAMLFKLAVERTAGQ